MPNLRLALRTLVKTPFLTAVAVASLALGIGANAAIFSLFHELLLQPLPVPAPDRLVNLAAPGPKPGSQSCGRAGDCDVVFSYPMFRDLERQQTVFTGIAAHQLFRCNLSYDGQTTAEDGVYVSGSYFPTLGLTPAAGRLLAPSDDAVLGEPHAVVLAYDYWQSRFATNPDVVGRPLVVNGVSMTIVGVAPRGFSGTTTGVRPQIFAPITTRKLLDPIWDEFENRSAYWAYLFAQLRPGVTIEQARRSLGEQYHQIVTGVEVPLQKGMSDQTMARFKAKPILLTPGARGQSNLRDDARGPLTFLFILTGLVLLIACANVANLLLARSAAREGEMAIRLSIGAGRRHLITQLLTESCLLAVTGGVVGLGVAYGTLAFIGSLLPAQQGATLSFQLDPTVLVFSAALSIGTGLLFGLFPALHSTRPNLAVTLKNQAGQPSGGKAAARFRTALVTAQITVSMLLLIGAGLFTKSLANISRVDLGIQIDHLVTFAIAPAGNGYTPEQSRAVFERVEDSLTAIPGVASVSSAVVPLIAHNNWGTGVMVQGFDAGPDTDIESRVNEVGTGFFGTVGMPMLAGRDFTKTDTLKAPKVAIVNETFVKKFKLDRGAVGMRLRQGGPDSQKPFDTEIVGVVADAHYSEVKQPVPPLLYLPYRQDDELGYLVYYLRTRIDPASIVHAIPETVHRIDANLPVMELRTMPEQVRDNTAVDRTITTLAAAFAVLATLLAGIGLYGVLAYTVSQRTREFGLRMALGAAPLAIGRLVARQLARMTVAGGIVGVGLALVLGRYLASLLFQMQSTDATIIAAAVVLLLVMASAAGIIPALRASRIDPMRALRTE
jgi:predicted permease